MGICLLKRYFILGLASLLISPNASSSTLVPISVGEMKIFTPLPALEDFNYSSYQRGRSISLSVGSSANTEAFYFRVVNSETEWQCSTASEVAAQGNNIIAPGVGEGNFSVEVSACMTGNGCNVSAFTSGNLACSKVESASVEVVNTGVISELFPSESKYDHVHATGAEFRVNEMGAATYQVPFSLPKGTAGVQPSLGLSYSSSGGNGLVGKGWNIFGGSIITRCPKNFAQDGSIAGVRFDQGDRLCLDGQRLVTNKSLNKDISDVISKTSDKNNVTDSDYWSADAYHTELDSFSHIVPHYNNCPKSNSKGGCPKTYLKAFTVETKSGEIHYYGRLDFVTGNTRINGKALLTDFMGSDGKVDIGNDSFVELTTNSNKARMWALKAIKDVKGNYILYKYEEDTTKGQHYLKEIQYTGNLVKGKNPYNRVEYEYKDNPEASVGWIAGNPVSNDKLLDKVVIYADEKEFRTYTLSYRQDKNFEQEHTLEKIKECVSDSCLKPLTFKWKTRKKSASFKVFNETPEKITLGQNPMSSRVFDINGDSYADIVYFGNTSWNVKLGPDYNSTKVIFKYKGTSHGAENAQIIDYNGDGILDLLVAQSENNDWVAISYCEECKDINVKENCNEECKYVKGKSKSLKKKAIGLIGNVKILDINGDALSDIVFLQKEGSNYLIKYYENEGNGDFSIAKDLGDFPVIDEGKISIGNAPAMDINGDGRSDLIVTQKKTFSYGYGSATIHSQKALILITKDSNNGTLTFESQPLTDSEKNLANYHIADLNGDGLSDLVIITSDSLSYQLSNGNELSELKKLKKLKKLKTTEAEEKYNSLVRFVDVNQDGKAELLLPNSVSTKDNIIWNVFFTRVDADDHTKVTLEKRGQFDFDENKTFQFGDANGDGKVDLFQSKSSNIDSEWFVNFAGLSGVPENVIIRFTSSFGVETDVEYDYINRLSIDNSSISPDKNYFAPQSGLFVVSSVSTKTTDNTSNTVGYEYGSLLVHKNGRGMLGFKRLRTRDLQTSMATETVYHQRFPYTGMPESTKKTLGLGEGAILLSEATNTLGVKVTANGGIFPYIKSSKETSYSLNSALTDSSKQSVVDSEFSYDKYGNQLTSQIYERHPHPTNSSKYYRETKVTNRYGTDVKYKTFGRLSGSSVVKTLYDNGSAVNDKTVNRSSEFKYYSDSLMIKEEIVNPTNNSHKLVTTNEYDKFGNKTKVSTAGSSGKNGTLSQTRSSATAYDERGQYAVSSTNSLDHKTTTTVVGNGGGSKGRITSIISTSPNGTTSEVYFDDFGGKKKTRISTKDANDPTIISRQYTAYCASPGVDCYTSSLFPTAYYRIISVSPGKPESQVFFDKWGRQVGSRTQAFKAGGWTVTVTEYDSNGNPSKTYEPKLNVKSSHSTSYEYDILKRVIKEVKPRGKVTRTYDGNTVKTVNEKNLFHKDIRNYLGEIETVTFGYIDDSKGDDSKGTDVQTSKLDYIHSADGDLLSVKVYDANNTSSHQQVTNNYNDLGQKIAMTDLDKGTWSYKYNAFGELVEQKNSSNQVTSFVYDKAGRKKSRKDSDGFTHWLYDSGAFAKGKLHEVAYYKGKSAASGTPTYRERTTYRSMGLVATNDVLIDRESFRTEFGYDKLNRLYYTQYPANNFTIKQTYTALGFPSKTINATPGHREYGKVYQEVTQVNNRGQVNQVKYGNGVTENKSYESDTGWLSTLDIQKGTNYANPYHSLIYSYDDLGNLETRDHAFASSSTTDFTESFGYDEQNRLKYRDRKVNGSTQRQNYTYDRLGNFKKKDGLGYYFYNGAKKNRLEYVYSGANKSGTRLYAFSYDNRGNIITDGNRTFNYTAFDKPYKISKGSTATTEFWYGHDRSLYRQKLTKSGKVTDTLYVKGLYERTKLPNGVTEHKYNVGSVIVTDRSNGSKETLYLHKDNLGSTVSITNAGGNIVQHFSYDPWGKQTAFGSHSIFNTYSTPGDSHGYTGHKMMNDIGIIHMNGRIYDPTLGRFLQADPHIQAPKNSQSYNRYSYVLNNPLSYTDPSGFFFKKLLTIIAKVPILNAGISVAFAIYCQACLVAYNAASAYAITGSLKAAFITGFTTAIMPGGGSVGNVLKSSVIGGLSSKLQGGKFVEGFWAAGLGAAVGGAANGIKSPIARVLVSAVIGGTVSKVTGGKFANGAYSGAFAAALTADWSDKVTDPKVAHHAKMSAKAYDGQVGDRVGDYEITKIHSDDTGLRAALFVGESGNQVLAYAGTDFSSLADWKANILQGLGLESTQYTNAIDIAKSYGAITFTGHSLGGGLASAAAIYTGGTGVVFNAAGLHNNTIGDFSRSRGNLTHYHSGYDAVSVVNAITPTSVPGAQFNLGDAGWHNMGGVCRELRTSC